MKKIIGICLLGALAFVNGCGGGGGGTGSGQSPPPTQPTNITVRLSVGAPPTNTVVRSVYSVITIPTNVTVKALNNGSPDVTVPAGIAATASPTAVLNGNQLTVTVLSTDETNGIPAGEFAIISCSYTGSTPTFSQVSTVAGGPPGPLTSFDNLNVPVTVAVQ